MHNPPGPVVCVSYLALAELWTVPQFPQANHGAPILGMERSIAADGPMTAAALASMGAPVRMISNEIGDDAPGQFVHDWLAERHLTTHTPQSGIQTPRIVVAADDLHTRTWFAHLPGIADNLTRADLSSIAGASWLYVEAYDVLGSAVLEAIRAGKAANVPLLLNLGGSALSEPVRQTVTGYPKLLIQTNVDDDEYGSASVVAADLLNTADAAWVIVTAGAEGSVAVSRTVEVSVPAVRMEVRHTHCAGAAYSAGLLYGLRGGWTMAQSMLLGSASGALRCARPQDSPLPSLDELLAVIEALSTEGFRDSA
ncbi:carbohydrate kinase family protein [Nocardia stercoris]|uniref:Carbohydrate kinase family protein n=1 Tax=Nocardia stercoris TaxID=2483361 RepID=A0A3M2LC77_9NOCA|nr:carbohydrate kinase family protein [Nocardia stercoris]RMI33575.1 carbohydrate kinase family protein [Nocardia stercoris]